MSSIRTQTHPYWAHWTDKDMSTSIPMGVYINLAARSLLLVRTRFWFNPFEEFWLWHSAQGEDVRVFHFMWFRFNSFFSLLLPDIFSQDAIFDLVSCSHYRAVLYFIHSINHPQRFKSFTCKNYEKFLGGNCSNCKSKEGKQLCQHLGLHVDKEARGKFYLLTTSQKPFSG